MFSGRQLGPAPATGVGQLVPLPDAGFDRIAGLAGRLLKMPLAMVTLFDGDHQRFIGRYGTRATGNTLDQSFCQQLLVNPERELVVQDAALDFRFMGLGCVQGDLPIRFYAGVPIMLAGRVVGTLCVFDRRPHPDFGPDEIQALHELAALALTELERHRLLDAQQQATVQLSAAEDRLQTLMQASGDVVFVRALDGTLTYLSPAAERLQQLGALPDQPAADRAAVNTLNETRYEQVVWTGAAFRPLEVRVVPDLDPVGRCRGTISVARDRGVAGDGGRAGDGGGLLAERPALQSEQRVPPPDALARLAYTDPLTGLGNRRELEQTLERHLSAGTAVPVHLCLIDLNEFKSVNDRFGHERGDQVLRQLGTVLEGAFPHAVYRLGGDEFAIMQQDASPVLPGRGDRRTEPSEPAPTGGLAALAAHYEQLEPLIQKIHSLCRSVVLPGLPPLDAALGIVTVPFETRNATEALRLAGERMLREKTRRQTDRRVQSLSGRQDAPHATADLMRETLHATLSLLTRDAELTDEVYNTLLAAGIAAIHGADAGSLYVQDGDGFTVVAQVGFSNLLLGLWEGPAESRAWYGDDLDWTLGLARVIRGDEIAERTRYSASFGPGGLKPEVYQVTTTALQASICVPIVSEGLVVGLVNFDTLTDEALFGPDELRHAEEFAVQLATIFTARSRARRERERQQEIERLLAVSAALHEPMSPQGIQAVLCDQTRQLLDTSLVVFLAAGPAGLDPIHRPVPALNLPPEAETAALNLAREAAAAGRVLQSTVPTGLPTQGVLTAPVMSSGGEVLGVLVVARPVRMRLTARDARLLMALADTGAAALERSRADLELQERAEEFRMLSELSSASLQTTDPVQVALQSLAMCASFFGADLGGYADLDSLQMSLLNGRTVPVDAVTAGRFRQPTGDWTAETAYGTRFTRDYMHHQDPVEVFVAAGLRTAVVARVVVEGELRGVLALGWSQVQETLPGAAAAILARSAELVSRAAERTDSLRRLEDTTEGALMALGLALEFRDFETSGHTLRVVTLAEQLGRRLNLPADELEDLRQGAYLHDVGKLAVPDAILLKPGALSPEEWETMKAHATLGANLGQRIPALGRRVIEIIQHHHERWDGSGYPSGLAGHQIPLGARLFTLVDTFDALTSDRPYKRAWPLEAALEEISRQSGRQFDPEIAQAFIAMLTETV